MSLFFRSSIWTICLYLLAQKLLSIKFWMILSALVLLMADSNEFILGAASLFLWSISLHLKKYYLRR